MQKENSAEAMFHSGWATVGEYGDTIIKSFDEGKDELDAPILIDQLWLMQHISHLEGQILTLLEATVVKDQQKGAKDMTRYFFGVLYADIVNATHTPEYTERMTELTNIKK